MIRIGILCLVVFACAAFGMCGDNCQEGALDNVRRVKQAVAVDPAVPSEHKQP